MSKTDFYLPAGKLYVLEAVSFWSWSRAAEGPKLASERVMDGGADVTDRICRFLPRNFNDGTQVHDY